MRAVQLGPTSTLICEFSEVDAQVRKSAHLVGRWAEPQVVSDACDSGAKPQAQLARARPLRRLSKARRAPIHTMGSMRQRMYRQISRVSIARELEPVTVKTLARALIVGAVGVLGGLLGVLLLRHGRLRDHWLDVAVQRHGDTRQSGPAHTGGLARRGRAVDQMCEAWTSAGDECVATDHAASWVLPPRAWAWQRPWATAASDRYRESIARTASILPAGSASSTLGVESAALFAFEEPAEACTWVSIVAGAVSSAGGSFCNAVSADRSAGRKHLYSALGRYRRRRPDGLALLGRARLGCFPLAFGARGALDGSLRLARRSIRELSDEHARQGGERTSSSSSAGEGGGAALAFLLARALALGLPLARDVLATGSSGSLGAGAATSSSGSGRASAACHALVAGLHRKTHGIVGVGFWRRRATGLSLLARAALTLPSALGNGRHDLARRFVLGGLVVVVHRRLALERPASALSARRPCVRRPTVEREATTELLRARPSPRPPAPLRRARAQPPPPAPRRQRALSDCRRPPDRRAESAASASQRARGPAHQAELLGGIRVGRLVHL